MTKTTVPVAAGAACATVLALAWMSRQPDPAVTVYVGVLIGGSALTLLGLARAKAASARLVLGIAFVLHLIALTGTAAFEDDFYRFIWDGYRVLSTGTPYGVAPETLFNDPIVPEKFQHTLGAINYPEYPTIYGPVLQMIFAAGVWISGASPLGIKLLFALANLALVAILLRSQPPHRVALYAWSPMAVTEILIHIHPDGVMALFLLAGLGLSATRPALAGAMLALAAGCKLHALAAWPLLFKTGWRGVITAPLVLGVLYLPFLVQGAGIGLDSTSTFASQWMFNPMLFSLILPLAPEHIARLICGVIGVGLIIWIHVKSSRPQNTPLSLIFGTVIMVAPAVNPWYLLWVLPFAVSRKEIWPWALGLALPLSYLTGLNLDSDTLATFQVAPSARLAEIAIILCAAMFDLSRYRRAPA